MKIKIFVLLIISLFLSLPVLAAPSIGIEKDGLAQKIAGKAGFSTNVNEYSLSETIGRVIKIILTFVGTIFFALMVYSGFLWMTAQGNEEQVTKAQGIVRTATIGLIVVVAAYSITAFIMIFTQQATTF